MSEIPGADERRRQQERMRREYPDSYSNVVRIGAVVIFAGIGFLFISDQLGYRINLFTEGVSILVTVLILDVLAERREKERHKRDLIYRMGSQVNHEAVRAVEELRRHGWLTDGSLKRANLMKANLRRGNLEGANLKGAVLRGARLRKAMLKNCNLQEADLEFARIEEAIMPQANLKGADLMFAYLNSAQLQSSILEGAFLWLADFKGATLKSASLKGAFIEGADFEGATLPNGDTWRPGYDMSIFTNPPDESDDTPAG